MHAAVLMAHASGWPLQYKFIVDGEWKYDPNQPAMFDEMRNVNNVIEVHEYVPEVLEGVSGFDPPPSPPSRCARTCKARELSTARPCSARVPALDLAQRLRPCACLHADCSGVCAGIGGLGSQRPAVRTGDACLPPRCPLCPATQLQ